MPDTRTLSRDVTPDECPWLKRTYKKGVRVYLYNGYTFGCVSPTGTAVTIHNNERPFFELPTDALSTLYNDPSQGVDDT